MVVFTCGHCGESVQKPKVEKHYLTKCRNMSPNLSCMDCFKDFLGNSYEEHIKCISEAERYSAKGFIAKEKKGEKKQNTWIDLVQSVLDEQKDAPKNVLRILEAISKHNNTPRKKPKFVNFVKNVCGHKTNPKDIDQAWDVISVKLSALSAANQQNRNQKNGHDGKENDNNSENTDNSPVNEEDNDSQTNGEELEENGEEHEENREEHEENGEADNKTVKHKKLSKKEKKEEKKRKKYEAELQSAVAPPSEEEVETKKGKKKKNKSEREEAIEEGKKNKRKRQDTVNSVNGGQETIENPVEIQNGVGKEKTQKKKPKIDVEEEVEDSMCLHEQNVAKIGELAVNEKFNWHAVIMSVLEKKGNELPFKRLQKKVLSEYSEITGMDVDDRIAEKFIKKLKSAPNVRVDKNRVVLVQ